MKKEDKEILIRDLCGRLPYGVKVYIKKWSKLDIKYYEGVYTVESIDLSLNTIFADSESNSVEIIVGYYDDEIKPYLFPMSSMTDEQYKEYWELEHSGNMEHLSIPALDWLNAHHFDYRGLIEKSLALDATGLNIY